MNPFHGVWLYFFVFAGVYSWGAGDILGWRVMYFTSGFCLGCVALILFARRLGLHKAK